ncbi:hypothetical protein IEE_00801 [Bacillus cereus BAG5X1-1]|uniref:Preprotein translocase subunit SecB n=1 Tax=Bacillus cereus BAG5X1-1 TaxID=1053189 RepID=J8B394_BACCE|nr:MULTISPECIES: protein-export chaperone SecB [Bacillus cereus group]EJQ49677.1 hypothetical protein IEE_00801 [Bacillus cereus BAG5X1-1]PEV10267.1 hypothetical protein CN418_22815 [Bacillus thuringiensis]UFH97148.1 protein-export chaperone SecB [Bacillus toyonensis]
MSNLISVLTFDGYSIDNFTYKRNYDFNVIPDEEMGLDFKFDVGSHIPVDQNEGFLRVKCTIFDEDFNDNKAPFFLELVISGHFELNDVGQGLTMEDFELNATTILLPYIRSNITSFTAQAGIDPVILPPINIYKVMEENQK